MPYLTPEEQERFESCIKEGPNPASPLLEELGDIKSLAELDHIAKIIRSCYQNLTETFARYLDTLPDDDSFKRSHLFRPAGSRSDIKVLQLAPDTIIPFLSFCLQKAGASQEDYQKLLNQYGPYIGFYGQEAQYYAYLKSAFAFLNQEGQLIQNEKALADSDFGLDARVLRLKKLIVPLEEVSFEQSESISEDLKIQLNFLLVLLKKEGDYALKQDQFEEAADQLGQLSLAVSKLVMRLADANTSKNSLAVHSQLITQFEDAFLLNADLSKHFQAEAIKEVLQKLVGASYATSLENVQKFSCENFSAGFLSPLAMLAKDNQLDFELQQEFLQIKQLFESDIDRLFAGGKFLVEIRKTLSDSVDHLTALGESFIESPLEEKEKARTALQKGIALVRSTFEAREIIWPLTRVMIDPKFSFSDELKKEFENLHAILTKESESGLKSGKSKTTVLNEFKSIINELEVFAQVMGSKETTRAEKKKNIHLLKEHFENQYSLLSEEVVSALRKFIGSALTSILLNAAEATVGFFKPAPERDQKMHEVKGLIKKAEAEIKTLPSESPSIRK